MRVGVIGVGYLGRFHARIYNDMPGVDLVGVADTDRETADRVAAEYDTRALYDPMALLDEVDVVSVVVPTSLHRQVAVPYLEKGIHMLLEKPVASTLEDARVIVETARQHNATLQIGHLERFNAGIMALADHVNEPRFIEAHRLGPFVERATDVDVITDLMIHDLDLVLSLVDEEVEDVQAIGASVITDHIDLANVRLSFPGGAVANITASRVSNKRFRRFRVFGPEGYYGINLMDQELDIVTKGELPEGETFPGLDVEHVTFDSEQPLQVELAHFVDVANGNSMPLVTGLQGLRALELANQIQAIMREPKIEL